MDKLYKRMEPLRERRLSGMRIRCHGDFHLMQVLYTEPSYPQNRYHFAVRNDVSGIGQMLFNNAPSYGSAAGPADASATSISATRRAMPSAVRTSRTLTFRS